MALQPSVPFNGKIKSALLSKCVICTPDAPHSSPYSRQNQGERVAQSPLLRSGKARCLGGAEQLVSWEGPAKPALGVPREPRCYEKSQCPSTSSGVNHTPRLGLWEKIHVKDTVSACRTCQIPIRARAVCEGGKRRFSRGFSSRSIYPLCPKPGFFERKLLERAGRSPFYGPWSILPICKR